MADKKCVLRYCGATVADYDEKVKTCPCLNCFGTKKEICDISDFLQEAMCKKCRCYNGR